jgi:hypothetical protein
MQQAAKTRRLGMRRSTRASLTANYKGLPIADPPIKTSLPDMISASSTRLFIGTLHVSQRLNPTLGLGGHHAAPQRLTSTRGLATYPPSSPNPHVNPGQQPKFSFASLGLSRRTKIAPILAVGFAGSAETVFYAQWVWRWWKRINGGDESEAGIEEGSG